MTDHPYSPISQGKTVDEDTTNKPGFFPHLMFSWLSATMSLGYSRALEENDVPLTAFGQENTADLTLKLENALIDTSIDGKRRKKKLWRSLLRVISPLNYAVYISTMLGESICRFFQPVLVSLLLWELSNNPKGVTQWGFVLASGLIVTLFLRPFCKNHFEYAAMVIVSKMRSSLRGIIYQKV